MRPLVTFTTIFMLALAGLVSLAYVGSTRHVASLREEFVGRDLRIDGFRRATVIGAASSEASVSLVDDTGRATVSQLPWSAVREHLSDPVGQGAATAPADR